jgi:hypothetical protein
MREPAHLRPAAPAPTRIVKGTLQSLGHVLLLLSRFLGHRLVAISATPPASPASGGACAAALAALAQQRLQPAASRRRLAAEGRLWGALPLVAGGLMTSQQAVHHCGVRGRRAGSQQQPAWTPAASAAG